VSEFELESSHLKLLEIAARAWDRVLEARESLAKNGVTFSDRHGVLRPRPEIVIERNSSILFARMLRELRLGDFPEADERDRVPRNQARSPRRPL
jgi:hypothetical protein